MITSTGAKIWLLFCLSVLVLVIIFCLRPSLSFFIHFVLPLLIISFFLPLGGGLLARRTSRAFVCVILPQEFSSLHNKAGAPCCALSPCPFSPSLFHPPFTCRKPPPSLTRYATTLNPKAGAWTTEVECQAPARSTSPNSCSTGPALWEFFRKRAVLQGRRPWHTGESVAKIQILLFLP